MDYSKSGGPKRKSKTPRNTGADVRGAPQGFGRAAEDKAKLLAKMAKNRGKSDKAKG